MTMHSMELLPQLQGLPADEPRQRMSFRDAIAGLVSTDRAMFAAEFTAAASFSMWGVLPGINVDDTLAAAYESQYPGLAGEHSLHEHWREMMERGPEAMEGFVNGLKGKVAEFNTKDLLETKGYTNVEIARDPTQEISDISAIDPDGQPILIQVKTVAEGSASEVQGLMEANLNVHYYVSTEVYDRIVERAPDLVDRLTDIGSTEQLEEGVEEGLGILSRNMGVDIPDGIVDIIPYAAVIVGGARLAYSVLRTEKEFKAADRTTKNQIQVVQTLTLMSRMGISTVLATAGGAGGGVAGSAAPGVGNAIGMIGGSLAGAGMGMYLNKHLQPHMLDLALNITGLTRDDLFYYKNKPRINELAITFQTRAGELAAAPGL